MTHLQILYYNLFYTHKFDLNYHSFFQIILQYKYYYRIQYILQLLQNKWLDSESNYLAHSLSSDYKLLTLVINHFQLLKNRLKHKQIGRASCRERERERE